MGMAGWHGAFTLAWASAFHAASSVANDDAHTTRLPVRGTTSIAEQIAAGRGTS